MRQLSTAWVTYAGDARNLLVTNVILANISSWVAGWMDWSNPGNPDNTNADNLQSPRGILWPYTQSLGIYKCPSDFTTVTFQGVTRARVRSVSLNGRLNGGESGVSSAQRIQQSNNLWRLSIRGTTFHPCIHQ